MFLSQCSYKNLSNMSLDPYKICTSKPLPLFLYPLEMAQRVLLQVAFDLGLELAALYLTSEQRQFAAFVFLVSPQGLAVPVKFVTSVTREGVFTCNMESLQHAAPINYSFVSQNKKKIKTLKQTLTVGFLQNIHVCKMQRLRHIYTVRYVTRNR